MSEDKLSGQPNTDRENSSTDSKKRIDKSSTPDHRRTPLVNKLQDTPDPHAALVNLAATMDEKQRATLSRLEDVYSNFSGWGEDINPEDRSQLQTLFPQYSLEVSDTTDVFILFQGLKRQYSDISLAHTIALYDYKHQGFGRMNADLRAGTADDMMLQKAFLLNEALGFLPSYKGIVYRGLRNIPPEFEGREKFLSNIAQTYSQDAVIEYDAFTSTASNEKNSLGGMVLFVIKSKTGKDLSAIEDLGETEVLFRLGSMFKVTDYSIDRLGRPVITMDEIADDDVEVDASVDKQTVKDALTLNKKELDESPTDEVW